ncbi:MAG TPA: hypothetical protein VLC48_03090 [Gemmatimonadota bacterium]|nr:hypothetical protein [Gemmatimonadota bacterium]
MIGKLASGGNVGRTAGLAILIGWMAAGCVGEQSRPQERRARQPGDVPAPASSKYRGPVADTAQPVDYRLFDTRIESESPRKVEYWIMTAEVTDQASLSKTLRVALDSIAGSDSTLVAARGILYTVKPIDNRRGELTPRVWGEWVPPTGWDGATAESRAAPHRIYTFNQRPDW